MVTSAPSPPSSPPAERGNGAQNDLIKVNNCTLTFLIIIADLGMLLFGFEVGASCWLVYAIQLLATSTEGSSSGYYYSYVADNSTMLGFVAALVSLGALIGYVVLLMFGDSIAKNTEIMAAAAIYVVGGVMQSISSDLSWENATGLSVLLIGRFLYGVGIAMSLHAIPQYVAEVTPKETRSSFGATVEATLMCGMTLGYLVGYLTDTTGWTYTFTAAYILASVMLLGSFLLPPSPMWMYANNVPVEQIVKSLQFIYPDFSESTAVAMKRACELDERDRKKRLDEKLLRQQSSASAAGRGRGGCMALLLPYLSPQLRVIVLDKTCRRGTTIAVVLNVMKILTGQTATMYYLSTIFGYVWTSSADIEFNSLMYILSRALIAMAMIYAINLTGRREWLMISLFLLFASQFVMFFGFMYGIADMELMTYMTGLGFEVGLGAVCYLVQPEVVPFYVRSSANAVANTILFFWYFLVVFLFPYLLEVMGMDYMFLTYSLVSLVSLYFIVFYIPETKDVALEETHLLVDAKFDSAPDLRCCTCSGSYSGSSKGCTCCCEDGECGGDCATSIADVLCCCLCCTTLGDDVETPSEGSRDGDRRDQHQNGNASGNAVESDPLLGRRYED